LFGLSSKREGKKVFGWDPLKKQSPQKWTEREGTLDYFVKWLEYPNILK
jgi:hypothetical protein